MGVGIVSTAELFRDPVVGFLRRRMIAGDLQSAPSGPLYKRGQVSTGADGKPAGGERIPLPDGERGPSLISGTDNETDIRKTK
jgi:hypothetical protein